MKHIGFIKSHLKGISLVGLSIFLIVNYLVITKVQGEDGITGDGLTASSSSEGITVGIADLGITKEKLASGSVTLDKIANNDDEPNRIQTWTDDVTDDSFTASGGGSSNTIDTDITLTVPEGKAYYYQAVYSGYLQYNQSQRVGSSNSFNATWRMYVANDTTPISLSTLTVYSFGAWTAMPDNVFTTPYDATWIMRLTEGTYDIKIGVSGNSNNTMNSAHFKEQKLQIMRIL